MTEIKKWNGWKKIAPSERENVLPLIPEADTGKSQKSIPTLAPKVVEFHKPFALNNLKKIDTKAPTQKAFEKYSREISRIDEIKKPEGCTICGNDISKEYFILYHPQRIKICRGCRQSKKRCPNCLDLHGLQIGKHIPMCDDCSNKKYCTSCLLTFESTELTRIEGKKGVYCESCLKGQPCHFCQVPTKSTLGESNLFICQYCASTSINDLNQIFEIEDQVKNILSLIVKPLPLAACELDMMDPLKPSTEPIHISGSTVMVARGIPMRFLTQCLVDFYSETILKSLPQLTKSTNLHQAFKTYFRLIIWHKTGDYINYEAEKKSGLRSSKEFQPLFQAFDKLGAEGSWKYLTSVLKKTPPV